MAKGTESSRRFPHFTTTTMSYPTDEHRYSSPTTSSSSSTHDPRHQQSYHQHHQHQHQHSPYSRQTSSPLPWSSYSPAASAGYQQSYEQQPTLPTLNLPPPDAYMDSHNSYTSNRPSRSSSYPTGPGVYPSSAYSGNYSPVSYHNTTTTSSMQRRPINETTSYYDTTPSQWPLDHFGSMEPEESKPFPSSSSSASSSSSYHPYRNHPPLRALSPPPPIVPTSSSAPPPPPQAPPGPKSCAHCHTTTTPMWRREPQTARPLCNACGLYMQQRNMRRPQELIDADGPSPSSHSPSSDPSSASSSSALPYDGPECSHCHTHITSVWRRNKAGDQVCNACGVYLRLKGKERPLDLAQKRNKIKPRLSKKDTWAASSSS